MFTVCKQVYFPAFEQRELDGKGAPLIMQLALCHFRSQSYKLCGGHVEGHSFLAKCVYHTWFYFLYNERRRKPFRRL